MWFIYFFILDLPLPIGVALHLSSTKWKGPVLRQLPQMGQCYQDCEETYHAGNKKANLSTHTCTIFKNFTFLVARILLFLHRAEVLKWITSSSARLLYTTIRTMLLKISLAFPPQLGRISIPKKCLVPSKVITLTYQINVPVWLQNFEKNLD